MLKVTQFFCVCMCVRVFSLHWLLHRIDPAAHLEARCRVWSSVFVRERELALERLHPHRHVVQECAQHLGLRLDEAHLKQIGEGEDVRAHLLGHAGEAARLLR